MRLFAFARIARWTLIVASFSLAAALPAQEKPAAPAPDPPPARTQPVMGTDDLPTTESIQLQLDELEPRLAQAEANATREVAERLGVELETLRARADLLRERQGVLRRLRAALERVEALSVARNNNGENSLIPAPDAAGGSGPPSYDQLLRLEEQAAAARDELETLEMSATEARREIEAAREQLANAQKAWREAREEVEVNNDPARGPQLAQNLEEAETRLSIARSALMLGRLRTEAARMEADRRREYLAEWEGAIRRVQDAVILSSTELDKKKGAIRQSRAEMERLIERRREASAYAVERLELARSALEAATEPTDILQRRAHFEYLQSALELDYRRLSLLEERLEWFVWEEKFWERLHAILIGRDQRRWGEWAQEAAALAETLASESRERLARQRDLGAQLLDLRQIAARENVGSDSSLGRLRWTGRRVEALEEHQLFLDETREASERLELLAQLVREEALRRGGQLAWKDRLGAVKDWGVRLWNAEIYHLDERPITTRKLAVALLALPLGFWISRRFARGIRRWSPRAGVSDNAAAATEKLFIYGGAAASVVVTLRLINIPLTAFAFMGGAAAIAAGFGAQNILNNFISGLILTADRPIRVGDVIEVDNVVGIVAEIGARSARIQTFLGTNTYFPNSYLVENRVDNLMMDGKMRVSIRLSVEPDAPTRYVARLIREAAGSVEGVAEEPPPLAIFQDFTESGYLFEVFFWVDVSRGQDYRVARSEVRHAIVDAFRREEVTLAFPRLRPNAADDDNADDESFEPSPEPGAEADLPLEDSD